MNNLKFDIIIMNIRNNHMAIFKSINLLSETLSRLNTLGIRKLIEGSIYFSKYLLKWNVDIDECLHYATDMKARATDMKSL